MHFYREKLSVTRNWDRGMGLNHCMIDPPGDEDVKQMGRG